MTEIQRVLPTGSRVYLLGNTTIVSDDVRAALVAKGFRVTRLGGATPAATARAVANRVASMRTVSAVVEVSDGAFADAWSASPAAVHKHAVILLTGVFQKASTRRWLDYEIEMARKHKTPIIGVPASGAAVVPPDVRAIVDAAAGWDAARGEFLLPYEAMRTAADPASVLFDFLQSTYDAAADLAGWDRALLEDPVQCECVSIPPRMRARPIPARKVGV